MSSPQAEEVSAEAEILLVDPEPSSRAALARLLAPIARLEVAGSGEEGLRLAREREYAAILLDLRLPDADAFQVVTELRRGALSRNVPVLFLTDAVPDWLTERRGYALGALGYLTKPVDPQALRARLEVLLLLFRRGLELRQRQRMIEDQHATIHAARAALEEAAAANRAKDLYLGVLGHDLRNPLGAILMSSRMLLMRSSLPVESREALNRIARNAERMASLIRDILDYTRGQSAGGLPIVPRSVDMREICESMVEEMVLLHADRRIRLQASGDVRGEWDRGRVEQVLSNLLGNALQHGEGEIRLDLEGDAEEVTLCVCNEGAPIPPDELPHLFEPFRRGARSSTGIGLGLYIVREIVRAHGGSIEVFSRPGEGTRFVTRWPRRAASNPIQHGASL